MGMIRRKYWLVAVLLILGILYTGCGKSTSCQSEKSIREELVLWSYYETNAQQEGLNYLAEKFNASQDRYTLSWEYVPMSEFIKQLSVAVSASSLPDLVLVDNPDMQGLVNAGLLADMTDKLDDQIVKEDYYAEVWETVEYDGSVYGVPFCCNNTAIIYNKTLLNEAGLEPPETWEEFKEAAEKMTILTEEKEQYGFVMSAAAGEQCAFQFMPWIFGTGTEISFLAEASSRDAFWLLKDMIENGSMPNDCINWSQTDVTRVFVAGKAAMIENGPWALPEIEKAGIDYGICPFPTNKGNGVIVGGENLVAISSKNVDGAAAFMNFYNQEEIMEEMCAMTASLSPKQSDAEAFSEQNPQYRVFVEQMEYGISRKSIDNWKNVCIVLTDSLYRLFGTKDNVMEIWKVYRDGVIQK